MKKIKKKDKFYGLLVGNNKQEKQRLDSTFDNCEYCNCCKDQIPCNCGCNSNNNSNSLSQNDPEIESNILIFDHPNLNKLNESLLDTISIEKCIDLSKINYFQNSLDVASLDEFINDELINEEFDRNIAIKLDENDNQSFEIIKQDDTKKLTNQINLNNHKSHRV